MVLHRILTLHRTAILIALAMGSILVAFPQQTHAVVLSTNSVKNWDFESGVDPKGLPNYWNNDTHDCSCTPAGTVTVNDSEAILAHAARLDIGQTQIGFMGMHQDYPSCSPPPNSTACTPFTRFSNFTAAPDELDFWFRLDTKYAGLGDFQIKFLGILRGEGSQEMDYVIDPHITTLSYPNQTFPQSSIPSLKYIFLGRIGNDNSTPLMAQPGTWVHFTRNVSADWTAQMTFYNSTGCTPCLLPGFPLSDTFDRIEFDNIGFHDASGYHGMTVWIDNVKFYWNGDTTPLPPPPSHFLEFNFTDTTKQINVDKFVQWRIYNASGYIGPYTRGMTSLEAVGYWVEAYYPAYTGQNPEPYRIFRSAEFGYQQPYDTNLTITLPVLAEPMTPGGFVAFSSRILDTTNVQQSNVSLAVNLQVSGSAPVTIFARTPVRPTVVVKTVTNNTELYEGSDWFYDPALSIVQVPNSGTGEYTLYFVQQPRIPSVSFVDRVGQDVTALTGFSFNMTNSLGLFIPIVPGRITLDRDYPYYLQAYFEGHRIYRATVAFSLTQPIELEMLPVTGGYLIVNSTIVGVNITQQSSSSTAFDISGTGPFLILVPAPVKPLYVEVNGAKTADWTYDNTYHLVTLETQAQGAILIVYGNPPADYTLYYVAAGILALLGSAGMVVFFSRRRRMTPAGTETEQQPSNSDESSLRPRKRSGKEKPGPGKR